MPLTSPKINAKQAVIAFTVAYGRDESRLQGWQDLCRDVGVEIGRSITQCRKILKTVHINLVDFMRTRGQGVKPRHFTSLKALSRYIRETEKWFPKKQAKANRFLTALLIEVW